MGQCYLMYEQRTTASLAHRYLLTGHSNSRLVQVLTLLLKVLAHSSTKNGYRGAHMRNSPLQCKKPIKYHMPS